MPEIAPGLFLAESLNSSNSLQQQYEAPLSATPQWRPGQVHLTPDAVQLLASYMGALNNHPLLNGQLPHPASPIFNAYAEGQAQQISQQSSPPMAARVLGGIFQNTVGSFVQQWQQDPLAAAGMVAGFVALNIAAGALAAPTGGLSEVALWSGFALLNAPQLAQTTSSVMDAIHDPTDSNVSQALINAGTSMITIGSPIKAFRGLGAKRLLLEQSARRVTRVHAPGDVADEVFPTLAETAATPLRPGQQPVANVRKLLDPTKLDTLSIVPQTVDQLDQQLAQRAPGALSPINADEESVTRLRQALQVHERLASRVATASVDLEGEGSPLEQVSQQVFDAQHEQRQFEQEEVIPAQRDFAARYGYQVSRGASMPRPTSEEVAQVPAGQRSAMQKQFRPLWAMLQALGEGHWDGMGDGVLNGDFAGNLAEVMARQQAPGTEGFILNHLNTHIRQAAQAVGLDESHLEPIYNLIDSNLDESSPEWQRLSPAQKLYANQLHTTFGVMSNYAWKHGHIDLQLGRWVPRMVDGGTGTATRRLRESLAPSGGRPESRSYDVQQQAAFDSQDEELAARIQPSLPTRDAFHGAEEEKQRLYQESLPVKSLLDRTVTVNGKDTTVDQFIRESNRALGSLRSNLNRLEKHLREGPAELDQLRTDGKVLANQLTDLSEQAQQLRGRRGQQAQRDELDRQIRALRAEAGKQATKVDQMERQMARWATERDPARQRVESFAAEAAHRAGMPELAELIGRPGQEIRKLATAQPGGAKLVSGFELTHMAFSRYLRQMVHSRFRESLGTLGYALPVHEDTRRAYGAAGAPTLNEIKQHAEGERPIVLHGDIKLGGIRGDNHSAILKAGYSQIFPRMGKGVTEQPALYMRSDLVERYKQLAERARSAGEQQTALVKTVTNVTTGLPRRAIMYSPVVHGKNMLGQFVSMLVADPTLAGHAMFTTLRDRMLNPERYYQTKMESWLNGAVPANRFNVGEHLNWLEQEMSGQRNFGYMVKHPLAAYGHIHAKLAEGWFWKTVDDLGTAGYVTMKAKLLARKTPMSDGMAGALAAEYANNVTGQINPLYMSKLWRWGRQMAMFAPSWWTSFYRMGVMSLPGSTRLSHLMRSSDRFSALDPVKFHSLDIRHRKELVRAHRNFFVSGMAGAMVAHDMMNFMASGHHVWDNQPGHEWDLEVDKIDAPKLNQGTGKTEHAHVSGIEFFSRQASLLNAIGIGHDYGFLHQMNDASFKQMDTQHKAGAVLASLGTGFRKQAAGKTSPAVTEGVGGVLGIDPYSLAANGELKEVPRSEAMVGLLPGGFQTEALMDQQRRAATKAAIETDDPSAQAAYQKLAQQGIEQMGLTSAIRSGLGLPDPIYSGDEPAVGYHFLSEREITNYLQSRQAIHEKKLALSNQLMSGQLSPFDWRNENEMQTQRYLQLLADTYGGQQNTSPANDLFTRRRELFSFLNQPNLTREQSIQLSDQADAQWEQMLANASPEARGYWWQAHTSQWTDADYLYWLSSQVKNSLAAHIDGDHGNQIRAAQARLNPTGLPLDSTMEDQMRQQSPYLWTYNQVLKEMGRSSLLGALTSAYFNPFANFTILPDQEAVMAAQLDQAGALKSGSLFAAGSKVQGLAAVARGASQAAGPGGGQLADTQMGQQLGQGLSAEEAQRILASGVSSSNKPLTEQEIAWLTQVAQGGRA